MASDAGRTSAVAVVSSLAATVLAMLWSMAAITGGAGQPPAWLLWLLVAANGSVAIWLAARRPDLWTLATATGLALVVALPLLATVVHATWELPVPVVAGVAGSAVAVAVLAPVRLGRWRLLEWATGLLTVVVWVNLLAGVLTLADGPVDASYLRNERDWVGIWQLRGLAGHPNALALVSLLAALLQVSWLRRRWPDLTAARRAAWIAAGPVTGLIALIWSQSRTGWLAAVFAGAILALPWRRDGRGYLAAGAVVLCAFAAVAPLLAGRWGVSFNGRTAAWAIAAESIGAEPALGGGPDVFSKPFWVAATALGHQGWQPAHAHNQLLHAGVLLGAVGLLLTVATFAAVLAVAVRARRFDRGLALAVVAATSTFAGVEPVLGAGTTAGIYLPPLILATVLGAAAAAPREKEETVAVAPDAATPIPSDPGERPRVV